MSIFNILARGCAGAVLLSHGLIHLIMPSMWNGTSPLLAGLIGSDLLAILVNVLLGATVLNYAVAAGGLVHIPVLRDLWMEAAVLASLSSLSLFALMWNALTPDFMTYMCGPIVSFIAMVPVSLHYWKVRGPVSGPLGLDAKEAR